MSDEQFSEEALEKVKSAIPPGVFEAMFEREQKARWAVRREERIAKKRAEQAKRGETPKDQYGAIRSGRYRRWKRPESDPADRAYVPGVLRHFRKVHSLTQSEAQARIGYSAKGTSWASWELGIRVPSYRTLLRIIASTGLGYWIDHDHRNGMDGEMRLERDRTEHEARQKLKR